MTQLFISIYRYLHHRKNFFWISVIAFFGISVWSATRLRFEEDLTKAFPNHPEFEKINYVFKNSSLGERIVMMVSFDDSQKEVNPDSLVVVAETIADSLNRLSEYVRPVNVHIDFGRAEKFFDAVIEHLPVFLEERDYNYLDSIVALKPDEIIREAYLQLISPVNIYPKKILVNDPLGFSRPVLKRLALQLYDENFTLYDNCIFTTDFRNLIFFVEPTHAASETGFNSKLVSQLKILSQSQKQIHQGISVSYFGPAVMAVSNAQQLKMDTRLTLSIMMAILALIFGFYFRSWRPVVLLFLPVAGGAIISLALISLIKGSISVLAIAAGSIVLGIAVNYSLHFLVQSKYSTTPEEIIKHLSGPLTLGNVTTVLAFLFLQLASAEVLRDIGLFAGFSLFGAAFCSLIILPPLWSFISVSTSGNKKDERNFEFNFFHSKWIFTVILLLTVFFGWLAPGVKFNNSMNTLSFMDQPTREAQRKLESIQGGVLASIFTVADGNSLKEVIQKNERLLPTFEKLSSQVSIKKVNSISKFLNSDSVQIKRIERWNDFWKTRKEKSLSSLSSSGLISKSLGEHAINSISKRYETLSDLELNSVATTLFGEQIIHSSENYSFVSILTVPIAERSAATDELKKQGVFAFDKSSATQMIVSFVKDDFNLILTVSSLVVFIALWLAYRHIELAIISFLPMIITWIWILGIMALAGIEFNMINVMISTFIFGLGDDYSIFVMDGLRHDYAYGKKSLSTTNISIVLSALTTMAGLGVLIFAKHPALRSIALISIVGIFCVFIMSQTIQPFLFEWITTNRTRQNLPPITLRGLLNTLLTYFLFVTGSFFLTIAGLVLWLIPFQRKQARLLFHKLLGSFARALIFIGIKINWEIMKEVPQVFSKPSIIIANHSSFLDILLTVMLHPKLVLFTNKWVWNSPVFGGVVRLAGYLTVENDFEKNLKRCGSLINDGYSIVIFPEGTRSSNGEIRRFHKGAFLIAEKLQVDIQPLLIYGAWNTVRKNQLYVSENKVQMAFLPRIKFDDQQWGVGYPARSKNIANYMRAEMISLQSGLKGIEFGYKNLTSSL